MISVLEMMGMKDGEKALVSSDYAGDYWAIGEVIVRYVCSGDDEDSVRFMSLDDTYSEYMHPGELDKYEPKVEIPATAMESLPDRTTEEICEELGIFRPELDSRKVGKVRVELVDDGFPLALREIAKVMTWAQTAKGYKDHDWQNLPNAEVQLAAAASRHRTDHIEQRIVEGLSIEDCVDKESSLLHKAHEAFGVLAQLELMLRDKF